MVDVLVDRLVAVLSRLPRSPRQERGQTLAEYAIIIALLAAGTVSLALIVVRTQVLAAFDTVADCFTTFPCS